MAGSGYNRLFATIWSGRGRNLGWHALMPCPEFRSFGEVEEWDDVEMTDKKAFEEAAAMGWGSRHVESCTEEQYARPRKACSHPSSEEMKLTETTMFDPQPLG